MNGKVFGYEALLRNWNECGFDSIFDVFDQSFRDKTLYAVDLELKKKAIEKFCTIQNMESKAFFYNLDNRVLEMPDYSDKDQKKKMFAENIVNMSHLMGIKV